MIPAEAEVRALALVSHLPGDRGAKRRLSMARVLQAYIDASNKGSPDLLVLAGYVAPAEAWVEFSKEWQARLNQRGIPYFKMTERSGDAPEFIAYFYRVIEEYGIEAAVSCVVKTDELVKVARSINWPPLLDSTHQAENPYFLAVRGLMSILHQRQTRLGLREPIDFIFDEEAEKTHIIAGWEYFRASHSPDTQAMMGSTPSYRNDKTVLPLQAADLYAWWVRKWFLEAGTQAVKNQKFPWSVRHKVPRLHIEFREAAIRDEYEAMASPERVARTLRAMGFPERVVARYEGIKMSLPDPSSPWRFSEEQFS